MLSSGQNLLVIGVLLILIIQPISTTSSPAEPDYEFTETEHFLVNDDNSRPGARSIGSRSSVEVVDLNRSNPAPHPNATIQHNLSGLFGFDMASGDVNADGIDDLVIGAPAMAVNGSADAGAVFVIFGSSMGAALVDFQNLTDVVNVTINGTEGGDRAGEAVSCADINGDSIDDIIIGAPEADSKNNAKPSAGEVYVLYGRGTFPTLIELNTTLPGPHQNVTIFNNESSDRFGQSLLGSDIVGTGQVFEDIIISAPEADGPTNSKPNAGEVAIIKGSSTIPVEIVVETSKPASQWPAELATVIFGPATNQYLGQELASGDVNGTSKPDLFVSAMGRGPGGIGRTDCGEIYLLNGNSSLPPEIDLATDLADAVIFGQSPGDLAGFSIAVDNVNFDNHNDIILGAPFADGPNSLRADAGEAYIIYGNGSFAGSRDLDPQAGIAPDVTIFGEGNGSNPDKLGYDIASGDSDYDGTSDIFIGAVNGHRFDNGLYSGSIYQVSTYYPLPTDIDMKTNESVARIFVGADDLDQAGFKLITGDFDGVPGADIAISAPYADGYFNNASNSGEVFINFGDRTPRPDVKGPFVLSITPIMDSTGVQLDEPIVIEFDEPVDTASFKFQCIPDPGNWQINWNPGNDIVTMNHDNFSEVVLHRFNIISANDTLANTFNFSYWTELKFTTGDFSFPVILNIDPPEDSTNVNIYKNITVTFSEAILPISIQFNSTPDPGGWQTQEWNPNGTVLTLKHANPFLEEQFYTFEIVAATDFFSNPMIPGLKPSKWNFTTGKLDPIHPWVVNSTPAADSTEVSVSTYIEIEFNEQMNITSVLDSIEILPAVPIESSGWYSSTNSFKLRPQWNLQPNTTYTVILAATAKDINGNGLDGNINSIFEGPPWDDYEFSFTTGLTGDIIPPMINNVRPEPGMADVNLDHVIEIDFSESMNESSVENAFIILPAVNGTFMWHNNFMTFSPTINFEAGTSYQISVSAGAKDNAGNGFDGDMDGITEGFGIDDFTWTFTTASDGRLDSDLPVVVRTLPEDGSMNVPINTRIEIEFSENMSWALTGDALGSSPTTFGDFLWNGSILIFKPLHDLDLNKIYNMKISALARDLSGKSLDGNGNGILESTPTDDFRFAFTTGSDIDLLPPTIESTYPEDGALQISRNTQIEITFSEEMMRTTTEQAFIMNPSTTGNFTWNDNIMIFKPLTILEPARDYTVTIKNSARDLGGNYFDGDGNGVADQDIVDDFVFSFTTSLVSDQDPPKVLSTQPQNGSTEVALDSNILIEFSEPMNKVDFVSINAFQISPMTSGSIIWSDNNMTFKPDFLLKSFTWYAVSISYMAKDLAGNFLDGNSNGIWENSTVDSFQLSFRTQNETIIQLGPVLLHASPSSGELDVALNQRIVLQFDQPMNTNPAFLVFSCSPDPGAWVLSWSPDAKVLTLSHDNFNESTEYTFTLQNAISVFGYSLQKDGQVPTTWKFTTLTITDDGKKDDDDKSGGLFIGKNLFAVILIVLFVAILLVVLFSIMFLMKLKRKSEEPEEEEEDLDVAESEDEEQLVEEADEDLEEMPPPPPEDIPVMEISAEDLDDLPPPPETVPTVPIEDESELDDKISFEDEEAEE
jgi:hypothetical protein